MKITAIVASTGRPRVLEQTLRGLLNQRRAPDEIIVSCVVPGDFNAESAALPRCRFLTGARGLCTQLNAALDESTPENGLIFIGDDDIELIRDYFEVVERTFMDQPDLAALGGGIISDGATVGREITRDEAKQIVSQHERQNPPKATVSRKGSGESGVLYGCNITYRAALLLKERFDENLPLYSLYFEADICRRMAKHGRVVGSGDAKIVHLAASNGRMPGLKMGYSQIANPYYLWREKGTVTGRELMQLIPKAIFANSCKWILKRDNVDRLGRLRGNVIATIDIILQRARPDRISAY